MVQATTLISRLQTNTLQDKDIDKLITYVNIIEEMKANKDCAYTYVDNRPDNFVGIVGLECDIWATTSKVADLNTNKVNITWV